ncbi:MAG: antibiotic biosynthesis monooxygenase [Gammaproteobacteria bacterium]|nr:antibiotic biosynthesis monooxygenase [Gammaproteobacteria bacterium]
MIVTIFRSRLRPEATAEHEEMAVRTRSLVERIPEFISIKTFTAPDGKRVSIVEFETLQSHQAWHDHPEHREAQRLGQERFLPRI